jgi:hypothetical protein
VQSLRGARGAHLRARRGPAGARPVLADERYRFPVWAGPEAFRRTPARLVRTTPHLA